MEQTTKRPKILGLKQLLQKKYEFIEGLSPDFTRSFGQLVKNFIMTVWAESGSGKSNFIMQLLTELMKYDDVLYVSLEEGTEATMQLLALRHLNEDNHCGKIKFADNSMNYDNLVWQLKKRKQPQFIVIDSVQYLDMNYEKYKLLKQAFPKKGFIFISHAKGSLPDGHTANKIRYDGGIKVRLEGYVAFVVSRYGGNKPYVVWEEGAKNYWKAEFKAITSGVKEAKAKKPKAKEPKADEPADEPATKAQIAEPETEQEKEQRLLNNLKKQK